MNLPNMQDFEKFKVKFAQEHPNESPQEVVEKMVQSGQIPLPMFKILKNLANQIMGTSF